MGDVMNIRNESSFLTKESIKAIESKYKARYVCESCLRGLDDQWVNFPAAIFYTDNPHPEGSNYFGIFLHQGLEDSNHVMITDGISATGQDMVGVIADNGDVIYSRYRHDYRESNDGSVFIDGGRDYTRVGFKEESEKTNGRMVTLRIVKDKLKVIKSKK